MPQFHPDIIRIITGYANTYLIRNGNNSLLIDTGLDRSGKIVLQGIAAAGLQPSDIRLIILTHSHFDHCRGARAIKNATGAKVMVQREDEAGFRRGYGRLPKGVTFPLEAWVSAGRFFMPWLSHFPPVESDIIVTKEYSLETYGIDGKVLHTPGHTKGSQTVFVNGKHAIAGDNVIGRRNGSIYPAFADDQAELIRSWNKLIEEGVEFLYPGHGNAFRIERLLAEFEKRRKKLGI